MPVALLGVSWTVKPDGCPYRKVVLGMAVIASEVGVVACAVKFIVSVCLSKVTVTEPLPVVVGVRTAVPTRTY